MCASEHACVHSREHTLVCLHSIDSLPPPSLTHIHRGLCVGSVRRGASDCRAKGKRRTCAAWRRCHCSGHDPHAVTRSFLHGRLYCFQLPAPSWKRCVCQSGGMGGASILQPAAPPHCASILQLQPLLNLSLFSLRPSLLQFVSIVSPLLNHGNPICEPVCVFYMFLFCIYFSDGNEPQL